MGNKELSNDRMEDLQRSMKKKAPQESFIFGDYRWSGGELEVYGKNSIKM